MSDEIPITQGPEAHWHAALAQGRFLIQRSTSSGTHVFPPRLAEPGTGQTDLEWIDAPGLGTVYSCTVIHPRPPAEPYNVVLVDLDGGARLMSRVDGMDAEDITIGMRVEHAIVETGDGPLIVFRPAGS